MYKTLVKVNEELAIAYSQLRNELSLEKLGKEYDTLTAEDKNLIDRAIPKKVNMNVSE